MPQFLHVALAAAELGVREQQAPTALAFDAERLAGHVDAMEVGHAVDHRGPTAAPLRERDCAS